MGKKKNRKTWYDFFISMHLGFCHGPVDALTALFIKDRQVWGGAVYGNTTLHIYNENLFGGNEREGGVGGAVHVMLGSETQQIPAALAARLGLTPATAPGFRRKATLALLGNGLGEGFWVGSNYPQVPTVWARFRRSPKSLNAPNAVIVNSFGMHDANPAHIIHECLVNEDFGMGAHPSMVDTDSFVRAAETLAEEKFGLSLLWTQQSTIEAFIQEVLDHIQGLLFFNPRTGLATLKLLRNDYDPDNLPEIGPADAVLDTFRRKLWGETVNEITISWTNPQSEETETLTYHDPANIAMQGEVVSENRHYYGIRSPELASYVGARDIAAAAVPLASASIRVNRRKWTLLPGDVIRFSWPKYNIDRIIMRVMEVDYGRPDSAEIKVNLLEDVFGLPYAQFLTPPRSEWEDPDQDPNGPLYDEIDSIFVAVPYPLVVAAIGSDNISDDRYPEILIAAMVTPRPSQTDFRTFVLLEEEVLPSGATEWVGAGERNTTGYTTLTQEVPPAVESILIMDLENVRGVTRPEVGGLAMLGTGAEGGGWSRREHTTELVMFIEHLGGNAWRVARGVLDTIPRRWPNGTPIRFIDVNFDAIDFSSEVADADVFYKVQPRTSIGLRDVEASPTFITNRPARPYMPFRPANVVVDGSMFEDLDYSENHNPRAWVINTSWSNRNRLLEDSVYRRWDEPSVVMEEGQTVEVCFWWSAPGNAIPKERRVKGLTGTSYQIDVFETGRDEQIPIKFVSVRDDLESLQGMERNVRLYRKGFGSDWGYFYGGWPKDFNIGEPVVEN